MNPQRFSRKAQLVQPPPRYTLAEWQNGQHLIHDAADSERQRADTLLAEFRRLQDEAYEVSSRARDDVEFRLKERMNDIKNTKEDMSGKFKVINEEIDAQSIYRRRVEHALSSLCHIIDVGSQSLGFRECRCGIDLVHDEPQKELIHEIKVVEGIQAILKRSSEFCTEQLRLLRKAAYQINKDLTNKEVVTDIDEHALNLNEHRPQVVKHCQDVCIDDAGDTTEEEWLEYTNKNALTATKVINASVSLRCSVDSILRQTCEDLERQVCQTNAALNKRIKELIDAKEELQVQHSELTIKIREMEDFVHSLVQTFEEKKAAAALAETRIQLRNTRPGPEAVKDPAQRRLLLECQELHEMMVRINANIIKAKNSMRNLQRSQLEVEDAINIKANSINIDECQIMPLRKTIVIAEF